MRLLLYNIRYGAGTRKSFHVPVPFAGYLLKTRRNFERIAGFIAEEKPDIVGLIEADSGSYRSHKLNQVEEIARALGHYSSFQSKYGERSMVRRLPLLDKHVNAFLTSHDIKTRRFHYFRNGVKRLVIELELEKLNIFLVHLSLGFRQRHTQLRQLHELVRASRKPVIVAGDFNPLWGADELALFQAACGLVSANTAGLPTFPSSRPRRQLDFILYSPSIQPLNFHIPTVRYSDHMPLIFDFELPP